MRFLRAVFLCLILLPSVSLAAIAHDGAAVTSGGTSSVNITVNSGDVVVASAFSTANTTTCTIGGSSMTGIGVQTDGGGGYVNTFYHLTPTVGTDSISCSGGTVFEVDAQAYSGASQSTVDGSNGGGATAVTFTVAVTTSIANDWVVGGFLVEHGTLITSTLTSLTYNGTTNGGEGIFDSNGTVSVGASNYSWTMGGSNQMAAVLVALTPAAAAATAVKPFFLAFWW